MTEEVRHEYDPRPFFVPYHQREKRWACMVVHRRAGKTVCAVNDAIARALYTPKKNARYAYVGPYYSQTKDIAWQYLKDYTKNGLAKRVSESELSVTLINDARVRLYGADNPDALRGIYLDGCILDEFGDMKPSLLGSVILPTLADRGGWLTVMGTAKGRNQFWQVLERAKQDPEWFWLVGRASETQILPDQVLRQMKAQQSDEEYRQEMECDFDAAVKGTYYADYIHRMEIEGRINDNVEWDPEQPVFVAADLGRKDDCCWWFWQERPDGIAVIDYYEANQTGVQHYIDMLVMKPYKYEKVWVPHDARAKTLATDRSTIEQMIAAGLPMDLVPKLDIQDGIEAGRMILRESAYINATRCAGGIEALRHYRQKWNEVLKCFSGEPLHDWSSNAADAWRYLALVCRAGFLKTQASSVESMRGRATLRLDDLFAERERNLGRYRRISQ